MAPETYKGTSKQCSFCSGMKTGQWLQLGGRWTAPVSHCLSRWALEQESETTRIDLSPTTCAEARMVQCGPRGYRLVREISWQPASHTSSLE